MHEILPPLRLFSIVLVLGLTGCSDLGSHPPPVPIEPPTIALRAVPDSGNIGAVVALAGTEFPFQTSYIYIGFAGESLKVPDSGSTSVLYTAVPFGAATGAITVILGDRLARIERFTVTETYDSTQLAVVPYNLSLPVTARDSFVVDLMGVAQVWHATLAQDTVHLNRRYFGGEVIVDYDLYLLDRGPGNLPVPLQLKVTSKDDTPRPATVSTATAGLIKIQDWNLQGTLSGRFFVKLSPWGDDLSLSFWVDRRR